MKLSVNSQYQLINHFVSASQYIISMTTKPCPPLRTLSCPKCCQKGNLQRMIDGMPGDEFDFQKYAVGGCLVGDNQLDVLCKDCGWSGLGVLLDHQGTTEADVNTC